MAKEKKTKFVILGFLLNDSLSGYEIGEMIKQSTNNFWKRIGCFHLPHSQITYQRRIFFAQPVYVGKSRKGIFTITNTGREAFLEWLKRSPDLDQHREDFY
jgi:DNA-binding PadR family transcriptional regulator